MLEGEFKSVEAIEKGIAAQPPEVARPIASRLALRVLPIVFLSVIVDDDQTASSVDQKARLILQTFRAAFVAWTACLSPRFSEARTAAAAAAADGAYSAAAAGAADSPDTAVAYASADAADAAATTAGAARAATRVARVAGRAARSADAEHEVWSSVIADLQWIEEQKDHSLIRQPIWLKNQHGNMSHPLWAQTLLNAFEKSQWVTHGPWGVLLAWYHEVLLGGVNLSKQIFNNDAAFAIAEKDEDFWAGNPTLVVVELAEMVAWPWVKSPATLRGDQAFSNNSTGSPVGEIGSKLDAGFIHALSEKSSFAPAPPAAPEKVKPAESVETQSDEPTADDQLGRRAFAQALVERMDKIYQKGGRDGFAAHIYAPWGAGKTSVLMMMRDLMIDTDRHGADGRLAPRWVVVRFNAWDQERRNPPWWPLVEAVKEECLQCLSKSRLSWLRLIKGWTRNLWFVINRKQSEKPDQAAMLQADWLWWKIRTDLLGYVVALFVTLVCSWIMLYSVGTTTELFLKIFTAAVLAFATFTGASRVAFFGSIAAAKLYEDISKDPLTRIVRLFKKIIDKTDMPVCIFIDDLDRCRTDYVVDLLEGIQTSFRHKNVAYVVAADRNWIKASFETRYSAFSDAVGNLGQPLGYLFLEKVFQVSTPVPGMGDKTRSEYWKRLLTTRTLPSSESGAAADSLGEDFAPGGAKIKLFDSNVESKRRELRAEHGENLTREQADTILKKSDTAEDRAAVVLELNASRAAEEEVEHLLAQFIHVLPDNPRVMKRMVNAFAMRQAIGLLERGMTPSDVLARWTILEQRFPALADLLIEHPDWTRTLSVKTPDTERVKLPLLLQPFVDSEAIRTIVGATADHGLTPEHVRAITRGSAT